MNSLSTHLTEEIQRFVAESPDNRMSRLDGRPFFGKPLVGVAHAGDPLFLEFMDIIGDFHLTPEHILAHHFPNHGSLEQAAVVSWILPISKPTRLSNRREADRPSAAWELTRIDGEAFNNLLRRHVVSFIQSQGYQAVAPMLSDLFSVSQHAEAGFVSNWSERHAAYAAGLGTFSLSRGLITAAGIAMRCGSVVTTMPLPATARPYRHYLEYCLFYSSDTCGACIKRCPAGAISAEGHDKDRCIMHIFDLMQETADNDYPGCGLCQTGVPCEAAIPKKKC